MLQGRTGAELTASYARTDLTRVGKCVPAPLKFTHGDPHEPRVQCFATVNQLAFGEQQHHGAQRASKHPMLLLPLLLL